jgi:hypothetical protein
MRVITVLSIGKEIPDKDKLTCFHRLASAKRTRGTIETARRYVKFVAELLA